MADASQYWAQNQALFGPNWIPSATGNNSTPWDSQNLLVPHVPTDPNNPYSGADTMQTLQQYLDSGSTMGSNINSTTFSEGNAGTSGGQAIYTRDGNGDPQVAGYRWPNDPPNAPLHLYGPNPADWFTKAGGTAAQWQQMTPEQQSNLDAQANPVDSGGAFGLLKGLVTSPGFLMTLGPILGAGLGSALSGTFGGAAGDLAGAIGNAPGIGGANAFTGAVGSGVTDSTGALVGGEGLGAGAGADVVGSDWAAGLPSAMNPGLAAGTAGGSRSLGELSHITTPSIGGGGGTPDLVGSDWATGQATTGPAGGTLPIDPATGLTAANTGAAGLGATGVNVPGNPLATAASGGSALSHLLDGTATTSDLLQLGGTGLSTLLSAYTSNNQANTAQNIANQQFAIGAPSRARYEVSMSPGFDASQIPGYTSALDTANQSQLRQLSASGGNPFGNPGGLAEAQKYVTGSVGLPAIQNYQTLNANTGGYSSYNNAAPGSAQTANTLSSAPAQNVAGGISALTNPQQSLSQLLQQLTGTGGNKSLFGLT